MIEPAKLDPEIPTIEWNGKQYPVPELGPKWLTRVWTAIPALTKALADQERGAEFGDRAFSLSEAEVAQLFDVVYVGLTRAHAIAREEFDEVPMTPGEAIMAFFVVRKQSGMYGRSASKKQDATPGEATAAGSPTGNGSSPEPAATSDQTGNTGGNT
jgi:hypothetical protein